MDSTAAPSPPPGPGDGSSRVRRGADDGTVISPGRAPAPVVATSMEEIGRALEGHALGHYNLERFVGGGGMGAVFRAVDTTLDRVVAVKVLSRQHSSDVDTLRRFKNEAQLAARLDHENIGRVHAVGSDGGWHFIVFEYIEGTNLRDTVLGQGPLDVPSTIRFTVQVAEALEHASDRGVVHRDIKPSNIIVTPAGRARLVDMGLARLPTMEGVPDLTTSGMTLGTFDYISPEQARDPRAADVRSDLYSLGCTMFFMLTGRPPFSEGTLVQKLLQHQQSAPPSVAEDRPDVPPGLEAIVARLLEKNPDDRYQRPAALVADLADLAGTLGVDLEVDRAAVTAGAAAGPRPRRPPWPWIVPVAALLALVAGLWLLPRLRARARPAAGVPATPIGAGAAPEAAPVPPPAAAPRVWRVVAAPDGSDGTPSVGAAWEGAGDGDVIECAFDGERTIGALELVGGKRVTLRAAEGHEPVLRAAASAGGGAAITVRSGTLVLEGIGLAGGADAGELVLVAPGAALEMRSTTLSRSSPGGPGGAGRAEPPAGACVRVGPSGAASARTRLRFVGVQAAGEGTFLVADPGTVTDVEWNGGACSLADRFLRAGGAPRGAPGTRLVVVLEDATIACRAGFAALVDSAAAPTIPALDVRARRCRFAVDAGAVFVEQVGIGTPEAYRGSVQWSDEGGSYEGGEAFRRIDGAAEREELPFPEPVGRLPSDGRNDPTFPGGDRPAGGPTGPAPSVGGRPSA